MRKAPLFILFLTSIAVMIMAELLVYQYLEIPYSFDFKASIFGLKKGESASSTTGTSQQKSLPADVENAGLLPLQLQPLTMPMLQKAGFKDVSLKTVNFDGLLFNQVDIKDSIALPVINQDILDKKGEKMASIYVFEVKSKGLAKEVYDILKKKFATQNIGIFKDVPPWRDGSVLASLRLGLNETHDFGEASFYLNEFRFPDLVFLVVKKNRNVYALTYGKMQHDLIKKLITILP